MGNTCCNDRGDSNEAIKQLPNRDHAPTAIKDPKIQLTEKEDKIHSDPAYMSKSTYREHAVHDTDITDFHAKPNHIFDIPEAMAKQFQINHAGDKPLPASDSKGHYKKFESREPGQRPYKYFGQVDGTKKHGRGQLQFLDGGQEFIIADFKNDIAEGDGTIYFANGDYYKGKLRNNTMSKGTFFLNNGNRYEGPFVNDMYEGEGTLFFADKRKYTGSFSKGRKEGKGVFNWPDGSFYDGEWRDGKQNGNGKFVDAKGIVHQGVFENGRLLK